MKVTLQVIFPKNKNFVSLRDRRAWYQRRDKFHFATATSFPRSLSGPINVTLTSQGLKESVAYHELQQMFAE